MKFLPKILFCHLGILLAVHSFGQTNADSLFTDFDITTLKPVTAASPQVLKAGNNYIRYAHKRPKAKQKIELLTVYKDTFSRSRKAMLLQLNYGTVLAFDVMKTAGFEKVLFFGDKDYYYDSLLIRGDTLCFKETNNDVVKLAIVYPVRNDTLIVQYGGRTIRLDFLKKFYFRPPLKNYLNWFVDPNLDYTETYTLVKKGSAYELIKVETNQEQIAEYIYKEKKEHYAKAGLSPFWIALRGLGFF